MKVCIDIQSAITQRAGVGRYTRRLVEHLEPLRGSDELSLLYFDFKRRGIPFQVAAVKQVAVRWCPGRLVQKCWKTCSWPPFNWFSGPADVYHFPNFIIPPLTAGRAVVTIHDLSFLRYPQFAETRNLDYLTKRIASTVKRADAIITDSQFSAREFAELLQVPQDKLHPIHPGIGAEFAPAPAGRVAEMRQARRIDRPYILSVGTLEPRKNLEFLITAFERMKKFDGLLVIAGMPGWKYESILEGMMYSSRAADIRYLQYVPDRELPLLYSGAELFVFPSFYEGFGFPPLEAMACGTPVLASNRSSLPEVLGDGALLIEDFDPGQWASAAMALISNKKKRKVLMDKGRRQAQRYSWRETARRTWDVYRRVSEA